MNKYDTGLWIQLIVAILSIVFETIFPQHALQIVVLYLLVQNLAQSLQIEYLKNKH